MSSQTLRHDPRETKQVTLFGEPVTLTHESAPDKFGSSEWYIDRWLNMGEDGKPKAVDSVMKVNIKTEKKPVENLNRFLGLSGLEKIPQPDADGKSLEKLVKIVTQLSKGDYVSPTGTKFPKMSLADFKLTRAGLPKGIMGKQTARKFLIVGSWYDLFKVEDLLKGKKRGDRLLHPHQKKGKGKEKSKRLSKKRDEAFFDDEYINTWLTKRQKNDKPNYHRQMFNALWLLGSDGKAMAPEDLAMVNEVDPDNPNVEMSDKDKEALARKRLMQLKLWSENPNSYNPLTKKPRKIIDGQGSDTGNRFAPLAKVKAIDAKKLPLDVDRLEFDVNPVIEKEGKNKGKILVSDRNNATMYNMVKVIRNFLDANKVISFGDQEKTDIFNRDGYPTGASLFSQEAVGVGLYNDIELTLDQIIRVGECLLDNRDKKTKEITLTIAGKSPVKVLGKINLDKNSGQWDIASYWQDAYFLFQLAVQALGGRASELFTIIAGDPINQESSGVKIIEKDNIYIVYIYTRKTELSKAGKIHSAFVPDSDDGDVVRDLIDKRRKQIDLGRGIEKSLRNNPKQLHSLIGDDNKFVEIDTIDRPTGEVNPRKDRQNIILNMLRHCYETVGIKHTYFYDKPIHALRHVFAKYWLEKSGYNYNLVMKMGHWSNQQLLEGSYGKQSDDDLLFAINIAGNVDPSQSVADRNKQLADLRQSGVKRERKKTVHASPKMSKDVEETLNQMQNEPTEKDASEKDFLEKDKSQGGGTVIKVKDETVIEE